VGEPTRPDTYTEETIVEGRADTMRWKRHALRMMPHAQRPGSTPTTTRPDLDRDQDVKPKGLRPHKVVVLDWTIRATPSPR
jgi:hypothetical protein